MNEPSVFNGEEMTLPKNSVHVAKNNQKILHRDFHNAYGMMAAKSTYEGLLQRDKGLYRPFLLTRSIFFGA